MGIENAVLAAVLLLILETAASSVSSLIKDIEILEEPFEAVLFRDGYSVLWGHSNTNELQDGMSIDLVLDRRSGSGFKSKDRFRHGFFSASIKLPANYSAGVVTAFYTSNSEEFPQTHDELDFEFLGVVPGMPHILQTNIYSNGSVHTGREERIRLWFDPTSAFHRYSILWNEHHVVFFVDSIPIRQLKKKDVRDKADYPSKSMSVYATIWDASNWATSGGRFPVDYAEAPFVASFTGLKLLSVDSMGKELSRKQKMMMRWARRRFLSYSYCSDKKRYANSFVAQECTK